MITLRDATEEDVYIIAPRLREADQLELFESGFESLTEGLSESLQASERAYVVLKDGTPEAIGGVAPGGVLWGMTTEDLMVSKKDFVRASRLFFNKLSDYNYLHNYVCTLNIVHIMWLKKLGFTLDTSRQIKPCNIPFVYFYRYRS